MDEAKGEYFLFVDGDDVLFPDTLQIAWQELDSGPFDWIMFDYIKASLFATSLPEYSRSEAKDFVSDMLKMFSSTMTCSVRPGSLSVSIDVCTSGESDKGV